jgi:Cu(I)/Ag(I) efflux system protein CusF
MNLKTPTLAALLLAASSAFATDLPKAEAEVRRVDTAANKISLKHGEIKNLDMPPMSMVFQVSDPALLTRVKAGDKVRFTADKVNGAYTVLSIEVLP